MGCLHVLALLYIWCFHTGTWVFDNGFSVFWNWSIYED